MVTFQINAKSILVVLVILVLVSTFQCLQQKGETFVLIHGATLGAWSWYKLIQPLEEKGNTVITLDLPSLGVDRTPLENVLLQDHVNTVLAVLDSLSEPAIVVASSYGGVVLSEVCESRPNKVKKAVYAAAFMLQDGESLVSASQRDTKSLSQQGSIIANDEYGAPISFIFKAETAKEVLCDDCSTEDMSLIKVLLKTHPIKTFLTPIHIGVNYTLVPKVYISALDDRAITAEFQQDMYSKFPHTEVFTIKASHLPWFAKPQEIAQILTEQNKVVVSEL